MNIFATSSCPYESARNIDNKRLPKMLLEAVQMFSTIGHGPYKPTHENHPCTLWLGKDDRNRTWTAHHVEALYQECRRRFGTIHKSYEDFYDYLLRYIHVDWVNNPPTQFANATTDYKHVTCVHDAYCFHMIDKWNSDVNRASWYPYSPPTFFRQD